ncbi:MAG: hypothetical protein FWD93_01015 [Coriobacteriia bacterium]|nr:hypothetical protein [Coriobacteriia bacterium]
MSKTKAEVLEQYGLDLKNYSADELQSRNAQDLVEIAHELDFHVTTPRGSSPEVRFIATSARQNRIIIRQNEEIIRLLQRIAQD